MFRFITLKRSLIAAAVAVSAIFLALAVLALPTEHVVTLTKAGYEPAEIVIRQNDTVTFKTTLASPFWPASNLHPQHTIYPAFDPQQPIASDKQWSFTFSDPGSWKYHDHINAHYSGRITVLGPGDESTLKQAITLDVTECSKVSGYSEKRQCWDSQLERAMELGGVKGGFAHFSKLYETEPEIPKECHGWGHTLGKAGYTYYKEQGDIVLEPETAYCGYGFYHAFLAELMKDTGSIDSARVFCEDAAAGIEREQEREILLSNCKHGVGHGISSMLSENPEHYGDFNGTSARAVTLCESVYELPDDLKDCYDGIYNEIYQNILNSRYGYAFNEYLKKGDPFWQCQTLDDQYKESCYVNVAGIFVAIFHSDYLGAMQYVLDNVHDLQLRGPKIVAKVAADHIQETIVSNSQADSLEMCALVPDFLFDVCFAGILNGFIQHGEPGNLHQKGYAFCDEAVENSPAYSTCYEQFTEQLSLTYSPEEMQRSCSYLGTRHEVSACARFSEKL